jgi:hypothetical protein
MCKLTLLIGRHPDKLIGCVQVLKVPNKRLYFEGTQKGLFILITLNFDAYSNCAKFAAFFL